MRHPLNVLKLCIHESSGHFLLACVEHFLHLTVHTVAQTRLSGPDHDLRVDTDLLFCKFYR